jgi:hypothetical protein
MSKHTAVKLAVRAYFAAALYFSFTHLTAAADRLGATGVEAVAATLMVDGFFILGAILRSEDYATRTRRIGLWVQTAAGAVSLAGNVYAANSAFGVGFGAALPMFIVLTEWLADAKQLKTAAAEVAEVAAAEAAAAEVAAAAAAEAERVAKNAAARTRRQARRVEAAALENLVNGRPARRARKTVDA